MASLQALQATFKGRKGKCETIHLLGDGSQDDLAAVEADPTAEPGEEKTDRTAGRAPVGAVATTETTQATARRRRVTLDEPPPAPAPAPADVAEPHPVPISIRRR